MIDSSYLKSALRSSAVKGCGNRRSHLRKNLSMSWAGQSPLRAAYELVDQSKAGG